MCHEEMRMRDTRDGLGLKIKSSMIKRICLVLMNLWIWKIKSVNQKNKDPIFFNPQVMESPWSDDVLLIQLYQKYGAKWNEFCKVFSNSTPSSIKERFYSILEWVSTSKICKEISPESNNSSNDLYENQDNLFKNKKLLLLLPTAAKILNASPDQIPEDIISKIGNLKTKDIKTSEPSVSQSQTNTEIIKEKAPPNQSLIKSSTDAQPSEDFKTSPVSSYSEGSKVDYELLRVLSGKYNFSFDCY